MTVEKRRYKLDQLVSGSNVELDSEHLGVGLVPPDGLETRPQQPPHRPRAKLLAQPKQKPRPMAGESVTHDATHLSPMTRLITKVELRGLEPLDSVHVNVSSCAFDLFRSISVQFVTCGFRFGVLTASTRRTAPIDGMFSARRPNWNCHLQP